jgi:tetraacyldisaccharide 4'-kinase
VFSGIYGIIVVVRRWLYDRELLSVKKVSIPVICLGNITTGGTGKTPMVRYLTEQLWQRGMKPTILTRGYKRHEQKVKSSSPVRLTAPNLDTNGWEYYGDEPSLLVQMLQKTSIYIHPDRYQSALSALETDSPDIFVMDDGFSHRRFYRDMDLVLLDVTNPFGYGHLLPGGLLREPLSSLKRASAILLTRCEKGKSYPEIEKTLQDKGITCPLFKIYFQPAPLFPLNQTASSPVEYSHKPMIAFCGIGNPAGFQKTLNSAAIKIAEMIAFPDHHPYTAADIAHLEEICQKKKAWGLVTTEKDALKLKGLIKESAAGWYCLPILAQPENEKAFWDFLFRELPLSNKNQ